MQTIERPKSEYFEEQHADMTKVAVVIASSVAIIIFAYLSYIAWTSAGAAYGLVFMAPVLFSAGIFIFLVASGRKFHKDIKTLSKYKVKVKF